MEKVELTSIDRKNPEVIRLASKLLCLQKCTVLFSGESNLEGAVEKFERLQSSASTNLLRKMSVMSPNTNITRCLDRFKSLEIPHINQLHNQSLTIFCFPDLLWVLARNTSFRFLPFDTKTCKWSWNLTVNWGKSQLNLNFTINWWFNVLSQITTTLIFQ